MNMQTTNSYRSCLVFFGCLLASAGHGQVQPASEDSTTRAERSVESYGFEGALPVPLVAADRLPPDKLHGEKKQAASLRLEDGRKVVLTLEERDIRFRPGTTEVEEYLAVVNVLVSDGPNEAPTRLLWSCPCLQFPAREPKPSEPHDFQLVEGRDSLLGVGFSDNGDLLFGEVDTLQRGRMKFLPLEEFEPTLAVFAACGDENSSHEWHHARRYFPRIFGMALGANITLESLKSKEGAWHMELVWGPHKAELKREALGRWKVVSRHDWEPEIRVLPEEETLIEPKD